MLRLNFAVVPREIFSGDPLAHEANLVRADVLVRNENIERLRAGHDLPEKQICLRHAKPRRERPVGAHALALHAASAVDDAGVLEPARGHEPPQPRKRRRNDVKKAHYAVVRLLCRRGRHANAEAPHVNRDRLAGHNVLNHVARNDHAGVRARLPIRVLHMLPDEARRARHAVHVEKQQWPRGVNRRFFVDGVVAVGVQTVHAEEPAGLGVHNAELSFDRVLIGRVAQGHIVRNRENAARLAQV